MAGTFPGTANTQQHDVNGQPLANCILTVYQGGTTTLAATYQDIGLVIPAPNPLVADATGRIPLFFVSDGSYALRLTDQFGIQSNGGFFYPQIPSIGASSSGGGGTPVDPTTVFSTGDTKWRLEESTIAGWVRINGRTIGNAASGASERANADTQALFVYIWTTFTQPSTNVICPVVGGIGASALADYNAGKQITLLDGRSRTIFGLDDMGNAALGGFTGVTFTFGNATTGGASGGLNATTLAAAQVPTITSSGTMSVTPNNSSFNFMTSNSQSASFSANAGGQVWQAMAQGASVFTQGASATGTLTSNNTGGQAFPSVPRCLLGTLFWKL